MARSFSDFGDAIVELVLEDDGFVTTVNDIVDERIEMAVDKLQETAEEKAADNLQSIVQEELNGWDFSDAISSAIDDHDAFKDLKRDISKIAYHFNNRLDETSEKLTKLYQKHYNREEIQLSLNNRFSDRIDALEKSEKSQISRWGDYIILTLVVVFTYVVARIL